MKQLREQLSEELDNFRARKTTVRELNATAGAIGRFLYSLKLELEYARMQGRAPKLLSLE